MRDRSRIAATLTAVALAAVDLSACQQRPAASAGAQPVLKIASQKGGTRALMEASHALDGAAYRVEWSEFPSAQTLLEALADGAVDAGAVGDAPFMFAYASGARIKVAQAYRASAGGASTAIVVKAGSPLHSPADLKGRRIATGKGAIGHYLLLRVLEQAGLKPDQVSVVYLAPGDAKAALASGSVDAWATWNPYVALATLHGEDRVLVDGRGLLHAIGFEAASVGAIEGKRAELADFLRRLEKAEAWEGAHQAEFAAVLARETGLPTEVAQATIASQRPTTVSVDAAVIGEERDTLAHFQAAGLIQAPPPVEGAFELGLTNSSGH
jgi:sulfonate transport system substrate-binding protein